MRDHLYLNKNALTLSCPCCICAQTLCPPLPSKKNGKKINYNDNYNLATGTSVNKITVHATHWDWTKDVFQVKHKQKMYD